LECSVANVDFDRMIRNLLLIHGDSPELTICAPPVNVGGIKNITDYDCSISFVSHVWAQSTLLIHIQRGIINRLTTNLLERLHSNIS